jgi:predicted metal-dependent phosphoesterase TrpH
VASDFHLHTTVSDGELTPVELLRHAAAHGVTALAITDHDTLEAYGWEGGAVFVEAERLSLALTVGVEIDAVLDGMEVHLLGFGLDPRDADLVAHVRCVEEARIERAQAEIRIVNGLLGRDAIQAEDIFVPGRRTLMKPHFIRPLLRQGVFDTYEAASAWFEQHVRGCGVDVPRPPLPDAIARVQAAGGWTALAHPGSYHKAGYPVAERLPVLRGMGLEGIELDYPYRVRAPHRWSVEEEDAFLAELRQAAGALGMRTTRGSDCHTAADFDKVYGRAGDL